MFGTNAGHSQTSSVAGEGASTQVKVGKFTMRRNVQRQLRDFAGLRASHPEKARQMHDRGEALIALAQQGKFTKLRDFINLLQEDEILTYYVVRAYKAALMEGHLMVVSLFIDEGYPFSKASVPAVLLEIMGTEDDDKCYDLVEFLVMKGYDVNLAAQGTWLTALHVSIRYGLLRTARLLVERGADINAVADGDVMPLTLAKKLLSIHCDKEDQVAGRVEYLPDQGEDTLAHGEVRQRHVDIAEWEATKKEITVFVKDLIQKGARVNWRKDAARARAAADCSSLRSAGDAGGSSRAPEKPKMKSFAGTVSKMTALSVEEARGLFAKSALLKNADGGTASAVVTTTSNTTSTSTSTTTPMGTGSATSQPKARRKLVVSEMFEQEVLPPQAPPAEDTRKGERERSSGVTIAESDDGAQLFSTG